MLMLMFYQLTCYLMHWCRSMACITNNIANIVCMAQVKTEHQYTLQRQARKHRVRLASSSNHWLNWSGALFMKGLIWFLGLASRSPAFVLLKSTNQYQLNCKCQACDVAGMLFSTFVIIKLGERGNKWNGNFIKLGACSSAPEVSLFRNVHYLHYLMANIELWISFTYQIAKMQYYN